jgi:hypothetical protein
MIGQLKNLVWKIRHHNGSHYTLDKSQHCLIKKYCRMKGEVMPDWPKTLQLSPITYQHGT